MHTCTVLLVTAVAACAIARPPGPTEAPDTESASGPQRVRAPLPSARELFGELLLPRFLLPQYLGYQETPRIPQEPNVPQEPKQTRDDWLKPDQNYWLDKEMQRLQAMVINRDDPYFVDESMWEPLLNFRGHQAIVAVGYRPEPVTVSYDPMEDIGYRVQPHGSGSDKPENGDGEPILMKKNSDDACLKCPSYLLHLQAKVLLEDVDQKRNNLNKETSNGEINNETEPEEVVPTNDPKIFGGTKNEIIDRLSPSKKNEEPVHVNYAGVHGGHRRGHSKQFALTPKDKEYFEHVQNLQPIILRDTETKFHHEGGDNGPPLPPALAMPPRQIRQNPISKQKHLLEPDIGKLKTGLATKDYRLPISLLPTNLRWLKINQQLDDELDSVNEPDPGYIERSNQGFVAEDPFASVNDVVLIAAIGGALVLATVGFLFGWYTLTKKAKAAADVDYPAYGVTGPSIDPSGDRKLAHSAHMYHYQHQKQQIIAMERNGLEQRTGSVSDVDSEEENEEGDYTVYECPGFATTGAMEVKNPLFSDDPTPATPGKCQVVKPQPK